MDSQEESSSSFYKTTYTDQSDSEADNINTSSTTNLISSKKKRDRNKSSFVWKYFKVIGDKDVCQIEIRKDKKCGQEYLHDKSISNMISHLRVQHNIVDNKRLKSEIQQIRQTTLPDIIKTNIPHKGAKRKEIVKAVIEWILLDDKPLSAPRKKGFRRMMSKIDPKFRPPSDRFIKSEMEFSYLRNIEFLRQEIQTSCETATITADLWTSRKNEGYIGVTCHWITPNWSLRSVLLCCEKMEYPHTAESIYQFLLKKCNEFKLDNKTIYAVTNNGANMTKAIQL